MAFENLHRPLDSYGFRGAIRWILIVSGVLLILQQFGPVGVFLNTTFGLVPAFVVERHWLWQPFTYLFLHGGPFHWIFNMFILWMFGRELEVRWGTTEFVKYFFITGFGAALCAILSGPHSHAVMIGSSGAVFGMLVAFAMIAPDATLYLYFLVPVKVWQAAAFLAVIEFFAALSGGGAPIAHLGGMLTGYLYLKFGWQWGGPFRRLGRWIRTWRSAHTSAQEQKAGKVELHEVTDDLVVEVDRILDKILKQGVDSLTPKEKELMEKYSRLKR